MTKEEFKNIRHIQDSIDDERERFRDEIEAYFKRQHDDIKIFEAIIEGGGGTEDF